MSWDLLPNELVEVVLANLSLIDLARTSPTCSSFKAVYRRLMAQQQKARCDLVFKSCSREQIACLVRLIAHLLKKESLEAGSIRREEGSVREEEGCLHISTAGVLYGPPLCVPLWQMISTAGDIHVDVWQPAQEPSILFLHTEKCALGAVRMIFNSFWQGVTLLVIPSGDEDLEPLAFMQVLLSEGLAEVFRDAGKDAEIQVEGSRYPADKVATRAGLKAQIAPLLPFASHYTSPQGTGWNGKYIEERMQIR
jgi:hypothetical protein